LRSGSAVLYELVTADPSDSSRILARVAAPSAQLIADLAREAQLRQLANIDSLDGKAATLVGFAGVVLGLIFTSSAATEHWNHGLSVGASVTAIAIIFLLFSLLPRRYKMNPSPIALAASYMGRKPEETAEAVVESINRAILYNIPIRRLKLRLLLVGASLVAVGLLIMSASLIYTVETSDQRTPSPWKGRTHE
jgi:hypothetical protein